MSSFDGLAPLLGRSRADLQVDHLSSQDPVDRVVQSHLVRIAPLLPVQLAVHLVLRADGSIEFLAALGRRGVNGLSHAFLEALLLVFAEPEYLGLRHRLLLHLTGDGQVKLLSPQQRLILSEVIGIFGQLGIGFRELAIGAIEIFISLVAILAGLFVLVDWHFVLVRAVEDAE